MKLSLSWIFEHIQTSLQQVDISDLARLINTKVVELEDCIELKVKSDIFMAVKCTDQGTILENKKVELPHRADLEAEAWYLLVLKDRSWTWATMQDLGGSKDRVLPSVTMHNNDQNYMKIKFKFENDYILHISNSSITHRPDLWSHRGFAREIAALLDVPLKPIEVFLAQNTVVETKDNAIERSGTFPFSIEIKTEQCKAFATAYLTNCPVRPSSIETIKKLCAVDIRPINALVDGTNLVMADLGHPMHAFDTKTLNDTIIVQQGTQKELLLLDNTTITTNPEDITITSADRPLSLAGIMGGAESSIVSSTKNILIEAAQFCPTTIRTSATRHNKRTESSMRFEKGLTYTGALNAIKRYLNYLESEKLYDIKAISIFVTGQKDAEKVLSFSHPTVQQRLGIQITSKEIEAILTKLDFQVTIKNEQYHVTVPWFRSVKDVTIQEDLFEEIGRMYGYNTITPIAPSLKTIANINRFERMKRQIKQLLSFGKKMHELCSYAFLDSEFNRIIEWPAEQQLEVKLPVSENFRYLADSLFPALLKAVVENQIHKQNARFFEVAKVWSYNQTTADVQEHEKVGFIITNEATDFYEGKTIVKAITDLYGLELHWKQLDLEECLHWLMPYKSTALYSGTQHIGYAGMIHDRFAKLLGRALPHPAFYAEVDLNTFFKAIEPDKPFRTPAKLQPITRNITFLLPKTVSAQIAQQFIQNVYPDFMKVFVQNFLEKDEWQNERAVSFELLFTPQEQSYTKDEIDSFMSHISTMVCQNWKASVR